MNVASELGAEPVSRDEARALEWFELALNAFQAAERAAGAVEKHYSIGSLGVRLRFAGAALVAPMTAALEHLAAPGGGAADLTICLFDGATGGALPKAAWGSEAYGARGEIQGFNVGCVRTVYDAGDHIFRMADLSRQCGLFWIHDAARTPHYERGAPLRTLFHWLMHRHRRQLAHAAAIGDANGAVLLAGKGGSGKSTSALACIGSGLRYAGDDYVVLADGASGVIVHSLYAVAKLQGEQAGNFPHLGHCVDNPGQLATEKALIFLARRFRDVLADALPLRAILLPKVMHRPETRVVPAPASAALAALAPTTVFQLPGDGRRSFETLATVARAAPSYWLELGTELEQIPEVVGAVLRR